ncbi:MAG: DUF1385 domain-containing protein [Firmicutes bacterium]|nr:DUF1385 domain-containing protein [Bacillota bacterium]
MDFSKIFIKNANPTKMGGQAVMEGIMMKGADRTAIAVRRGDGTINVKEQPIAPKSKWAKIPIIRGVVVFIDSLITGTKTLMYSAEVLEEDIPTDQQEEMSKFDQWLLKTFGEKGFFNILLYSSVVLALVFSVGLFVLLPTWVVGLLGKVVESAIVLNLIEGLMRIIMFVVYVLAISKMNDIKRVFQYHGAEHRTIHCFENGLELTPENCMQFESLHPRCGTSFLVFVMFISLLLFSFLGWPNVWVRLLSRLVLIPLVAGISFEVLKWAGSTDNMLVKILSVPGLYMQKLTTKDPDIDMIEVAIVAVKACLSDEPPVERIYDVDSQGNKIDRKKMKAEQAREKAVSEATDADLMSFAAEDDLFKAESISKE